MGLVDRRQRTGESVTASAARRSPRSTSTSAALTAASVLRSAQKRSDFGLLLQPIHVEHDPDHDHRDGRNRQRADPRQLFEDSDNGCPPANSLPTPPCHIHTENSVWPPAAVRFECTCPFAAFFSQFDPRSRPHVALLCGFGRRAPECGPITANARADSPGRLFGLLGNLLISPAVRSKCRDPTFRHTRRPQLLPRAGAVSIGTYEEAAN
jgi:hypothetical protein